MIYRIILPNGVTHCVRREKGKEEKWESVFQLVSCLIQYKKLFSPFSTSPFSPPLTLTSFRRTAKSRRKGDRSMFSANRFLAKCVFSPKNGPVPGLCSSPGRAGGRGRRQLDFQCDTASCGPSRPSDFCRWQLQSFFPKLHIFHKQ